MIAAACLFPGARYGSVLATAFGLPGLKLKPGGGTGRPSVVAGQAAARRATQERIFELDAAVPDAEPGTGLLWMGLEVTGLDCPERIRRFAPSQVGLRPVRHAPSALP